jgi:hypothetical protein
VIFFSNYAVVDDNPSLCDTISELLLVLGDNPDENGVDDVDEPDANPLSFSPSVSIPQEVKSRTGNVRAILPTPCPSRPTSSCFKSGPIVDWFDNHPFRSPASTTADKIFCNSVFLSPRGLNDQSSTRKQVNDEDSPFFSLTGSSL